MCEKLLLQGRNNEKMPVFHNNSINERSREKCTLLCQTPSDMHSCVYMLLLCNEKLYSFLRIIAIFVSLKGASFMDPIVSKIIKVTVGVAGLALCSLINSALRDEVSSLCDFDLDDF